MNSLSKPLFDVIVKNYDCKDIIHPWSKSCNKGILVMGRECFKGSIVFFSIMYAMTILLRIGRLSYLEYVLLMKNFIRSVILGTCHGTLFVALNCFARKLLGRFQYYVIAFLVPLMSGIDLVIDHQERRNIVHSAFTSMAVEACLRRILLLISIPRSRKLETLSFMFANGLLMHLFNKPYGFIKNLMWFFIPSKVKSNSNKNYKKNCDHEGSCLADILKGTFKYFSIGLFISTAKILISNLNFIKTPLAIFKKFGKSNMSIPLFAGGYVGIYKVITCFIGTFCNGKVSYCNFLAGALAGTVYWLNPSLPLLATVITVIFKIYGQEMVERKLIPNLPYQILTFALANAILFHTRVLHPRACPKFMLSMMNIMTCGREKLIFGAFEEIVDDYLTKNGIET